MNRIRKVLSVLTVALIVGLGFSVAMVSPDTSEAFVRSSNTNVFTGRFIPAFVGGAYDPSPAFSQIAGLPVYVFAYDFWSGANQSGENSWIVSDIAVRTQVRADGSFQVQGLPTASHYGVYFPFALDGGRVVRTDCTPSNADLDPCRNLIADSTFFRMPVSDDRIVDVFSYAAQYLNQTPIVVQSQVNVGSGYENIAITHAFITNRTEVDIANNINTFPLIPNTTLKVNLASAFSADDSYEIWALRIAENETDVVLGINPTPNDILTEFPVVKGRAQKIQEGVAPFSYYGFEAYAPPGYYVVIAWRQGLSSPTYDTWDGESDLFSRETGIAQYWVRPPADLFSESSDWQWVNNNFFESIVMHRNRITVWGVVTDESGRLFNADFGTNVNAISSTGLPYVGIFTGIPNDVIFVSPENNQTISHYQEPLLTENPSFAPRSIYILQLDNRGFTNDPLSDDITVYLDTPTVGDEFSESPRSTGLVNSFNGPQRLDIRVTQSAAGSTGGHDKGIYFNEILVPGISLPAVGSEVSVQVVGSNDSVSAEQKIYSVNRLGQLYIPPGDLQPEIANSYEDLTFVVRILFADAVSFYSVGQGTANQFFNGLVTIDSLTLDQLAQKNNPDYNLEILNFARDILQPDEVYAGSNNLVAATVTLNISPDQRVEGPITAQMYHTIDGSGSQREVFPCLSCKITTDEAGTKEVQNIPGDPANITGQAIFYVWMPVPTDSVTIKDYCINAGIQNCENIPELPQTGDYVLVMRGMVDGQVRNVRASFSVDSTPEVVPDQKIITLAYDCNSFGEEAKLSAYEGQNIFQEVGTKIISLGTYGWLRGFLAESTCSAGMFFVDSVPTFFSLIYKYGLQTRALTQDQPIGQIWDITRNVVNVLFILMFILISIMTIMRYQPEQWHIRVLLPKLLVALVLANFSLLLVQALLDLNNFITYTIFTLSGDVLSSFQLANGTDAIAASKIGGGVATAVVGGLGGTMVNAGMGLLSYSSFAIGAPSILIAIASFALSFFVVVFMQVLSLLLIFMMRYAVIWLLVVVGPAVMLMDVLPWFSGWQDRWLKMVIGVAFMQTAVAGVLAVGVLIMSFGSQENSFFGGWGIFVIGMIILYMAFKLPKELMNKSMLGGFSAPDISGGDFSEFRANAEETRNQGFQDQARDEALHLSETGQKATGAQKLGMRLGRTAGQAFRLPANLATGGMFDAVRDYKDNFEDLKDDEEKKGRKQADHILFKAFKAQNKARGNKLNISEAMFEPLRALYGSQAGDDLALTDMRNKPLKNSEVGVESAVGNASSDYGTFNDLAGSAGNRLAFMEFLKRTNTMNPSARQRLLGQANKYKSNPGAVPTPSPDQPPTPPGGGGTPSP